MPDIYGTSGNDSLTGTAEKETIYGLGGDDVIFGGDGIDAINDDTILGGPGNDLIHGGAGGDTIYDEAGNDIVYGDAGDDKVFSSSGDDTYDGAAGYDYLLYSSALAAISLDLTRTSGQVRSLAANDAGFVGVDTIANFEYIGGSNFDDLMVGDAFNNRFWGNAGNDSLFGGAGDDRLMGGAGNDVLDGGSGFDLADYEGASAGATVSLAIAGPQSTGDGADTLVGVEGIIGSYAADTLLGNDQQNLLIGNPGGDKIDGGGGDDIIEGGPDADTLTGGAGNDMFRGDAYQMNGDVITDFGRGDSILVQDAWVGLSVGFSNGQLTLGNATLTLSNVHNLSLAFSTTPEGGLLISIGGPPIVISTGPAVALGELI